MTQLSPEALAGLVERLNADNDIQKTHLDARVAHRAEERMVTRINTERLLAIITRLITGGQKS